MSASNFPDNPFIQLVDAEAVARWLKGSKVLDRLNSHIHRPLDRERPRRNQRGSAGLQPLEDLADELQHLLEMPIGSKVRRPRGKHP